jgi:hypothetical protein
MLVAEATADVLAGLGNSLNTTLTSMATAVEAALA